MAQTRWARYAARLGAVLLVAAGAAWFWAAVQRWWPECGGGRSLGSGPCTERQDHLYDYLAPTEPWVPLGSAASLAGAGCLLMAGGLLLVLPALSTERSRTAAVLAVATQALVMIPIGLGTLLAGLEARPVAVPLLLPTMVVWAFLLPAAFLGVVLVLVYQGAGWGDWRGPALLLGSLWLASPLVEYVLLMLLYSSHDTPPWSGALAGVAVVVAGVAVWWVPEAPDSGGQRDGERRVSGVAV
jgi:hypothetical protein